MNFGIDSLFKRDSFIIGSFTLFFKLSINICGSFVRQGPPTSPAFEKVLNNKSCLNQIINIGSNYEHSVLKVAKIILKEFKINKKIHKMKAPEGSALRRVPNIQKIKKLTGWYPKINIHEGIKLLCQKI